MAFDIASLLNSGALGHLLQPNATPGAPNMLAAAAQPQADPWAGMREVAPDPMQTSAIAAPQAVQPAPSPSFFDRYKNFVNSDRGNALGDFFTGLAMGSTPQQSLGYGARLVSAGAADRRKQGQAATQRNQTVEWLKSRGLSDEDAQLLSQNTPALSDYLKNALSPDAQKPTSDIQNYQFAVQGGYKGNFAQWQKDKGSGVTVNLPNQSSDMFAGLPKDVRDEMFKRQGEAQDAADLINVTNQGLQLLDQGAITGAGSGAKVAAIKWAQTLGVPVPDDIVSVANNTEAYRSIMAKAVGKVIKNFGSGTGLSDADRQYAERLAGGDTNLNEPAIRRILAAGAKQAHDRINGFKTMRDKVLSGDLSAMLGVQEVPDYTPAPQAPSVVPQNPAPTPPDASAPPASYTEDPKLWKYLTPEQKALWK